MAEHTPIPSTHHPLTHDWAHSYTLYSSPVNPRVSTLIYPHLMEISPYSWIVHLKHVWSFDVWIKTVIWIWCRICIINKNIVLYYYYFLSVFFQSIIVCHVSLIFTYPSIYLVDMRFTLNLEAFKNIFFVLCVSNLKIK